MDVSWCCGVDKSPAFASAGLEFFGVGLGVDLFGVSAESGMVWVWRGAVLRGRFVGSGLRSAWVGLNWVFESEISCRKTHRYRPHLKHFLFSRNFNAFLPLGSLLKARQTFELWVC